MSPDSPPPPPSEGKPATPRPDSSMDFSVDSSIQGDGLQPGDAYQEGPFLVFTAQYHLRRGYCCNSGCRHCPYK